MSLLASLLDKFAAADAVWYASTRADGRAHLAPVWSIWHAGSAWIVTQANSVRAQNLAHGAGVSLALPDPMNALILEGVAYAAPSALESIRPVFQAKYNWDIAADTDYSLIVQITPTKLMAWGDHGEGRWRYDADDQEWVSLR